MSTPTTAADHLSAAQAYEVALRAEYAVQSPNRQVIAELHSKIGRGIKFAEVKALIRIGDALERLVETAPGQYLVEPACCDVTLSDVREAITSVTGGGR